VVHDVGEWIRGGSRVVTVTGPPGIGKSRLAIEVAATWHESSDAEALRCELAEAETADAFLRVVARQTGARADPGGAIDATAIARHITTLGSFLIVLDDADGVLAEAAALVRGCVEGGAQGAFLLTSREPLEIGGERVVPVGALSTEAAVAVFEARAGGGARARTDVEALVDRLEGNPLAVELAAWRSRVVPPAELLARLDEGFDLLRSDRRDAPARHRSIAAAIDVSWRRLTDEERRALAALATFEGAVPLEAFEAVAGPETGLDPIDAAQVLLRKSLATSTGGTKSARLGVSRLVRWYVRRAAVSAGEVREPAAARHAAFYVERAEREAARAYGPEADEALDALDADVPNLLLAFAQSRTTAPERAARIAIALADPAIVRGSVDLHAPLFADAREAADASGDERLRALARTVEGRVLLEIGRPQDAAAVLAEATAIADSAALADAAADARRSLGWAELALGRPDAAIALLDRVLERHAVQPNIRGQADALAARGLARCLRAGAAEGAADLEGAYALHVVCDDRIRREKVAEMASMVGLALEPNEGDGDRATEAARLRASAQAHHAGGRPWREALVLFRLASIDASEDERRKHRTLAKAAAIAGGIAAPVTAALATASDEAEGRRETAPPWVIGPGARWIVSPTGERIDLARHGSLRLVLDALVERRLAEPGAATSAASLFEKGWPGERVRHESAMLRVYTAIRRLRALGLTEALETRDDGYLLRARAPFARAQG
jgi:predicted ATPase